MLHTAQRRLPPLHSMPVKAFDSSQGEGYSLWSRKVSASEVVETHKVFDTSEHQWDRKAHSDYEYTVCICIYIYKFAGTYT